MGQAGVADYVESSGTAKKSCCEAPHTDDLAVTAGSALRQLFIRPLKGAQPRRLCGPLFQTVFLPFVFWAVCGTERKSRMHVNE